MRPAVGLLLFYKEKNEENFVTAIAYTGDSCHHMNTHHVPHTFHWDY